MGDFFMDKKEAFKGFARLHPELVSYIKSGEMSWQKFYEIYDIYGEDNSAWQSYFQKAPTVSSLTSADALANKLKSIDMNSIQEHIKTAQKALNLVSELTGKTEVTSPLSASVPKVPRPINQFFED